MQPRAAARDTVRMPRRVQALSGTPLLLRPDWAVSLRLGGRLLASPPAEATPAAAAGEPASPAAPGWLAGAARLLEPVYPGSRLLLWNPRPEPAPGDRPPAPELWVRLAALAAFAAGRAVDPPGLAEVARALERELGGGEAPLAPFLAAALGGWVRTRATLLGERLEERATPAAGLRLWLPPAGEEPDRLARRVEALAGEAGAEAAGLARLRLPGEAEARTVAWLVGGRLSPAAPPPAWRPLEAEVDGLPVRLRIGEAPEPDEPAPPFPAAPR
ncbi:MAG: hypothetical protein K6U79_07005 [Firmicutes bacterium]|nr:hypothetical protein [Bacillota bacterium]